MIVRELAGKRGIVRVDHKSLGSPLARFIMLAMFASLVGACGTESGTRDESHQAAFVASPDTTATGEPGAPTPTDIPLVTPTAYFETGNVTPAAPYLTSPPTSVPWNPEPSDPFIYSYSAAYVVNPFDATSIVAAAEVIVIGQVIERLPARWTTPDGSRPENPFSTAPAQFSIITPVIIQISGAPLLNRTAEGFSSGTVVIAEADVQVGADSITTGLPFDHYTVGDQFVLALWTRRPFGPNGIINTDAGPGWSTMMQWVLDDQGMALWAGEALTAEQLLTELGAAAQISTPRHLH